jgi:hypothetical protein
VVTRRMLFEGVPNSNGQSPPLNAEHKASRRNMEDHEDEGLMGGAGAAHVSSPAMNGASSTVLTGAASKNGLQLLYNLLAIAYHVLEETKHVNLKPPLQPSSKLFTIDAPAPASPPRSPGPPDSPQEDGGSASEANGGAAAATHGLHAAHPIVIPYSPEEIQDSFTKIATLKNQYIKMSNDLLAIVKQLEGNAEPGSLADKVREEAVWRFLRVRDRQPLTLVDADVTCD